MSESTKTIIKFFCDRFLNLNYYPSSLSSILDLEIDKLKNISPKDIDKFNEFDVFTIRDLSQLDVSDYETKAKRYSIERGIFNNSLIAAYLIANAWNKRNQYLKKLKMKVVIAGLDYAGKTSLLNRLLNDYNYKDMINLEPTIGANVEEYQSEKLSLILWDLGGQKDHIDDYLKSPEQFFIKVDILIYVFDSQDDIRYDQAIKYLTDITNILHFLNEFPYFVILLNKADSDIIDDPDFQIKLEYLTDKISDIFMNSDKSWNFEIVPTSIYNFYSKEPEIATSIKNIFSPKKAQFTPEKMLPDIEEKLQKILDINLKLMDKVVGELAEVKRVLYRLTPSEISQSLFSVPFEKVPLDFIVDTKKNENKEKKKRKVKGKELFSGKMKKGTGPPQRLVLRDKPEEGFEIDKESQKITQEKIIEAKNSLNITLTSNKPPMAPPKESQVSMVTLQSLKPPPPPKTTIKEEISILSQRSQVISELKEMFVKRGLVTR